MKNTFLVITSIASQNNSVLKKLAINSIKKKIKFILIGDLKSPYKFSLKGCDFYGIKEQKKLKFKIVDVLPFNHYARKNIGYLIAIANKAKIIIETDDDNIPKTSFWKSRREEKKCYTFYEKKNPQAMEKILKKNEWVNIYKWFTYANIWPRGFPLEKILEDFKKPKKVETLKSPIQQGLVDGDPDVDSIYRMTSPKHKIKFKKKENIALKSGFICPFNSQNTTWFKEAFPLMYLPSYCSFRMTDIWRSFVAQRIAWECGWPILFHSSNATQKRNDHILMKDFNDEISGYLNNLNIMNNLLDLELKKGQENIMINMITCYKKLIKLGFFDKKEMNLLKCFLHDLDLIST